MEENVASNTNRSGKYSITVLLQDGRTFLFDEVSPDIKISDFVDLILSSSRFSVPPNCHITLIYLGHLLSEDIKLRNIPNLTTSVFTIHCIFRPNRNAPQGENHDSQGQYEELRGFDRLSRMNYTPEQIQRIRDQFHQLTRTSDLDREAQLSVEDEWFPALFNNNEDLPFNFIGMRNPNNHNRSRSGREDETTLFQQEDESAFNNYAFIAIILGAFFGFFGILFIFVSPNKKQFLIGFSFGLSIHYLFSYLEYI